MSDNEILEVRRTGSRVDLTLNRPNQYNALSEDLLAALKAELDRYLDYYNHHRAHTGRWTQERTPIEVIGKAKGRGGRPGGPGGAPGRGGGGRPAAAVTRR